MEETRVPVYLITGFLESGKTSSLSFTLQQDYFQIDGKTLLILCEEGEEEYDEEALKQCNTVVESIDSEEELTSERLAAMEILHQPERVIIEYNGMWLVSKFEEMEKPEGWGVEQHITCVDASTFQVYMENMKSLFMDMVRNADMVIFNRCQENDPLPSYRRSIKVVNQRAEIIFEDEEGELGDLFEDEMPFDIDAPVIDILPEDYGIWFVDSMDHPDRYVGKTVHFKARALKPRGMGSKFFVPGRTAMTCCADDTTFLGYICKSAFAPKIAEGQWVDVTAKVAFEKRMEYQGEGIVLYAEHVEVCEPLAADSSKGRQFTGVAKVLSTIRGTPFWCATCANFSISRTTRAGLAIVSAKRTFVFGLNAAAISSSVASVSTKVQSMPSFLKVTARRLKVPP